MFPGTISTYSEGLLKWLGVQPVLVVDRRTQKVIAETVRFRNSCITLIFHYLECKFEAKTCVCIHVCAHHACGMTSRFKFPWILSLRMRTTACRYCALSTT
jgi:fatty acid-binding protein DegV